MKSGWIAVAGLLAMSAGPAAAAPNLVISKSSPALTLRIDPKFDALKPLRFRYPSSPPRRFGAQTYRSGAFTYDDAAAAKASPDKEPGKTRAFLRAAGYTSPRLYRVARLARVSDPKGLSEVIIFYLENADAHPPEGKPDEDGDWSLSPEQKAAITERMEAAVKVVRG